MYLVIEFKTNKQLYISAFLIKTLGHGHMTKNGKKLFFFIFGPSHLFKNFYLLLDIFWKALDLGYRMNVSYYKMRRYALV